MGGSSKMDIELRTSPSQVEALFKQVLERKYHMQEDFGPLLHHLSSLVSGGGLTYEHLEKIADPSIWPFRKWWRWPAYEQISDSLKNTEGLFKALRGLSEIHEDRIDEDKKIIEFLYYEIFKNLELVSIVLRFIDEVNFAIYSPPVAFIIGSPRGYSYSTEYLNYLGEIRKYKNIYQLEKAAYVDMFMWAIEVSGDERGGILDLFHKDIDAVKRKKVIAEFIREEALKYSDLSKAIFYFEFGLYSTAAKWAGCAFEGAARKYCTEKGIPLDQNGKRRTLGEFINDIPQDIFKKYAKQKKRIVDLRNRAAHPSAAVFTSEDVRLMIKGSEQIISSFG